MAVRSRAHHDLCEGPGRRRAGRDVLALGSSNQVVLVNGNVGLLSRQTARCFQ
jgi:hypothetical protein